MHVTIDKNFDLMALLGAEWTVGDGRSSPCHSRWDLCRAGTEEKLGMWDSIMRKLARTEDVRAALLLVERGEAPAGIVYATDAALSRTR